MNKLGQKLLLTTIIVSTLFFKLGIKEAVAIDDCGSNLICQLNPILDVEQCNDPVTNKSIYCCLEGEKIYHQTDGDICYDRYLTNCELLDINPDCSELPISGATTCQLGSKVLDCCPSTHKIEGFACTKKEDSDQAEDDTSGSGEDDGTAANGASQKGNLNDIDVAKSGPTDDNFNALNPLNQMIDDPDAEAQLFADGKVTPANLIGRALKFLFPISGMILFVMIVWGGFEMLSTSATKKSMDAGRQRITAAIMGFLLLFASYWIMQLIEVIFGINVL